MKTQTLLRNLFPVLLIAFVVAILGCAQTKSAEKSASETIDDGKITASIKIKMADDELVRARNIDIDTNDGVVSLRGTVGSNAEEQQAIRIARNEVGVRSVRSFLKIDAASASTTTSDFSEDVKKTADKVGDKVEDAAEKVGDAAKKGVKEAKEGVEELGEKASDAAITAKVKLKLAQDDTLDGSKIDVDTDEGRVILNGKVASKAQENRAVQVARTVDDVVAVRSNLVVSPTTS